MARKEGEQEEVNGLQVQSPIPDSSTAVMGARAAEPARPGLGAAGEGGDQGSSTSSWGVLGSRNGSVCGESHHRNGKPSETPGESQFHWESEAAPDGGGRRRGR